MLVPKRLGAREPFSCEKCVYFDAEYNCRFNHSDIIKKSPDDWCGEGKWIVRYKDGLWMDTFTGVIMVRAQKELKLERKEKVKT